MKCYRSLSLAGCLILGSGNWSLYGRRRHPYRLSTWHPSNRPSRGKRLANNPDEPPSQSLSFQLRVSDMTRDVSDFDRSH
jgi:hypothetical protein